MRPRSKRYDKSARHTEFIKWVPFDGVGRTTRNWLNFTERGFGGRGAVGIPDLGHTAASQLKPGDFDWEHIFGKLGVRWLHTGGIFAARSESTPRLVIEAVQAAKKHGTIVSYDLNYRPSLWKSIGGKPRVSTAQQALSRFENRIRYCFGLSQIGVKKKPSQTAWPEWSSPEPTCLCKPPRRH